MLQNAVSCLGAQSEKKFTSPTTRKTYLLLLLVPSEIQMRIWNNVFRALTATSELQIRAQHAGANAQL